MARFRKLRFLAKSLPNAPKPIAGLGLGKIVLTDSAGKQGRNRIKSASHMSARSDHLRSSPEVCCLQGTKGFGTSFRNGRIGLLPAGHLGPAAFLDEHLAIPKIADLVQLGEVLG